VFHNLVNFIFVNNGAFKTFTSSPKLSVFVSLALFVIFANIIYKINVFSIAEIEVNTPQFPQLVYPYIANTKLFIK